MTGQKPVRFLIQFTFVRFTLFCQNWKACIKLIVASVNRSPEAGVWQLCVMSMTPSEVSGLGRQPPSAVTPQWQTPWQRIGDGATLVPEEVSVVRAFMYTAIWHCREPINRSQHSSHSAAVVLEACDSVRPQMYYSLRTAAVGGNPRGSDYFRNHNTCIRFLPFLYT